MNYKKYCSKNVNVFQQNEYQRNVFEQIVENGTELIVINKTDCD